MWDTKGLPRSYFLFWNRSEPKFSTSIPEQFRNRSEIVLLGPSIASHLFRNRCEHKCSGTVPIQFRFTFLSAKLLENWTVSESELFLRYFGALTDNLGSILFQNCSGTYGKALITHFRNSRRMWLESTIFSMNFFFFTHYIVLRIFQQRRALLKLLRCSSSASIHIPIYVCMCAWTEPSINGSHSRTDPRTSTREPKQLL